MEQIGFFEAAPAVPPPRPRGGTHRELILSALRKFGPMTVDQIAARTPLMSQQVNKRTPELERAELIRVKKDEAGQDAMRESLSGRPERVWEAV